MENPKGDVSSSQMQRGKSPSWVPTSSGAEVFMCSLCAAAACPRCETMNGLRAGPPGDQYINDQALGPGIDSRVASLFRYLAR